MKLGVAQKTDLVTGAEGESVNCVGRAISAADVDDCPRDATDRATQRLEEGIYCEGGCPTGQTG